jgi:hypothetical protein
MFRSISVHHSFSPFITTVDRLPLKFSHCSFSKFLDSAIKADSSLFLINKIYVFCPQEFGLEPIVIWHCIFKDFHSPTSGGAFWANFSVSCFNVYFENCTASKGGIFYTCSSVDCVYCTFYKSKSNSGGAFFVNPRVLEEFTGVSLQLCQFSELTADSRAGFYRTGPGPLEINRVNFTNLKASISSGAFESVGSDISIKFVIIQQTRAAADNGGIVLENAINLTISHTIFEECEHSGKTELAGAALYVTEAGPKSRLDACYFINSKRNRGHTIAFNRGGTIHVDNCCFSGAKEQEIFASHASVVDSKCRFSSNCERPQNIVPDDIGWRHSRSPTYQFVISDNENLEVSVLSLHAKMALFALACGITIIGEVLAARICRVMRAQNVMKGDRAFL